MDTGVTECTSVMASTEPTSALQKNNFVKLRTENGTLLTSKDTCEVVPSGNNGIWDPHDGHFRGTRAEFEASFRGQCDVFVLGCLNSQTDTSWRNCNQWTRHWEHCASKWCCNANDVGDCEDEVRKSSRKCPEGQQEFGEGAIGSFCAELAEWFSRNSLRVNPSWLQIAAPMTKEPKDDTVADDEPAVASLVAQLQQRKSTSKHEAEDTQFDQVLNTKCL